MTTRAEPPATADLERRLAAYAATGRALGPQRWKKNLLSGPAYAAAAGSALAFTTAADAGIIYSGKINAGLTNITFVGSNAVLRATATRSIPGLNALMSLRFNSRFTSTSGKLRKAGAASLVGNSKFRFFDTGFNLSRFVASNNIPSAAPSAVLRNFGRVHRRTSFPFSTSRLRTQGYFAKGVSGFAGFRFTSTTANGQARQHYGWIRLKWDDSVILRYKGFPQFLTVVDWAYNDTAGAAIHVGDTGVVPEPSSLLLGLLAAGAAGVEAWRRSRRAGPEPGRA